MKANSHKASTLRTQNEGWGFFGTIAHHADAEVAWALAMRAIAGVTRSSPEAVRFFLDSRYGRHFADDVASNLLGGLPLGAAIDAGVDRWMTWTISARTSRETGIPRGLPYLTGFVMEAEIMLDAA